MPKTRKRPAPKSRPSSMDTITCASDYSSGRAQDGYQSPTPDERFDAWIIAEAARLGYRISVPCLDYGRPLSDPISVAHHRGPTCRRRAGVGA